MAERARGEAAWRGGGGAGGKRYTVQGQAGNGDNIQNKHDVPYVYNDTQYEYDVPYVYTVYVYCIVMYSRNTIYSACILYNDTQYEYDIEYVYTA